MNILYLSKNYEDFLIITDMFNHIHQIDCELSFTANFEHAFDSYRHEEIDLYIIDLHSGTENALKFLSRSQQCSVINTPIIIIHKNTEQQALPSHAYCMINKYDINEFTLAAAINQITKPHLDSFGINHKNKANHLRLLH